jgi:hypothetical protein
MSSHESEYIGLWGASKGFEWCYFFVFFGLWGPPGPIYTTAGGGLGVLIEALSVGYHLEPFLSSLVHYSRIYGSYSDLGWKKVEIFFEATTFWNSSFCRYSEWEQKTHSWHIFILLISGCGGRQSGKIVQKKSKKSWKKVISGFWNKFDYLVYWIWLVSYLNGLPQ